MEKTITAANSVVLLSIRGLYPVPQQLEGYAADAMFDVDGAAPTEVVIGVDGKMSAGFTPFLTVQTFQIMPDSNSAEIFENWLSAMKSAREVMYADAVIRLPSIRRSYALTKGALSTIVQIPPARKVLGARPFAITWGSIDPAPL